MRLSRLVFRLLLLALCALTVPVFASPLPQAPPPAATPEITPEATMDAPSAAPNEPIIAGVIDGSKPVVVELTGNGAVDLRYSADDAVTINIQARSLDTSLVDTTLEVVDGGGLRLAFNDDHGTTRADLTPFDSLIMGLQLPARGDYLIRINTFNGASAGRVEVTLTFGEVSPAPRVGRDQVETVTGVVPESDRYTYGVELFAGDGVTLTVRATDNTLDPKVALVAPDGTAVATNDDHGTQEPGLSRYDSRISNFAVETSGFYTVEITGFGGIGGAFELTIALGEADAPQSLLSGSETVEGSVIPGVPFQHYFDANVGDVITISARAQTENLDVDLALYNLNEELLESNYEHGTSDSTLFFYDARINNYIVQETGSFLVEVTGYEVDTGTRINGDLELTIERVTTDAPLGLGDDQVFLGEIEPNGIFAQSFEAEAGDYVTIRVRSLTRGFDPTVDLLTPSGVLAETNDDHGSNDSSLARFDSQIMRYRVTESGMYGVEVGGYRDTAGSFGITVTTVR
ncbi:MAG: hypothetical protein SGI73_09905 [Chloroflexota bacterium]|nr:hypothetical protein [Chloroflexota bacterium]